MKLVNRMQVKRINIFNWGPSRASHSTFIQRTSIRCFFTALARAPTSFIGFAAAHLLHLRKSKNLLESTLMWSDVTFNPQLNDSLVVPSANRWTTCVLRCLYMWKSGFQTSFSSIGSYTSSGYSSECKVAASLDESVERFTLVLPAKTFRRIFYSRLCDHVWMHQARKTQCGCVGEPIQAVWLARLTTLCCIFHVNAYQYCDVPKSASSQHSVRLSQPSWGQCFSGSGLWSFLGLCPKLCSKRPPTSVGAARSGTLCKVSNGLSASLVTLTNSKTRGVFPTPHTGATIGAWRDLASGPDEQSCGYEPCTLSTLLFSLPIPKCRRCIRRHTWGRTTYFEKTMRKGNNCPRWDSFRLPGSFPGNRLLDTEHSGLSLFLPPCIRQFAQVHCLWGDNCSYWFNVQNLLAEIDCLDEAR